MLRRRHLRQLKNKLNLTARLNELRMPLEGSKRKLRKQKGRKRGRLRLLRSNWKRI
jgi:hypothetical protein